LLTRQGLIKTRVRAVRQKVWFKALSRVERNILDLTIRCVEKVRSRILAKIVSNILAKILKTLEPSFLEVAMRIGREIADEVCGIAENWGNSNALRWKHDLGFARFLGVTAVNQG
jgi:hypothetical protein